MDQSTPTFSSNVGGVVVKLLFRFSICGSLLEMFAIKVESCQKSRKILEDFLALLNFLGRAFQKLYPVNHSCLAARRVKKFREDTPNSPEVIEPNTLNFRPNFNFFTIKILGDPLPVPVCASKAWSICSVCKNFRAQHALKADI